jgi:RNA binding exosome subunit
MESIIIYLKNAKQKTLLKSLLEEMKIQFEIVSTKDETSLNEEEYYVKLDKSISQAEAGKTKCLPKDKQKEFLGI